MAKILMVVPFISVCSASKMSWVSLVCKNHLEIPQRYRSTSPVHVITTAPPRHPKQPTHTSRVGCGLEASSAAYVPCYQSSGRQASTKLKEIRVSTGVRYPRGCFIGFFHVHRRLGNLLRTDNRPQVSWLWWPRCGFLRKAQ